VVMPYLKNKNNKKGNRNRNKEGENAGFNGSFSM